MRIDYQPVDKLWATWERLVGLQSVVQSPELRSLYEYQAQTIKQSLHVAAKAGEDVTTGMQVVCWLKPHYAARVY